MKTHSLFKRELASFFILLPGLLLMSSCQSAHQEQAVTPVDFSQVKIEEGFWSPVLERHKQTTMAVCIDQMENQTGRIQNFINAAKKEGKHSGIYFDDSDVYKALEGFAYSLVNHPDAALEAKCDEWIDWMAAAQEEDGYLNTYYTLTGLENRWTDMNKHEMYCAGHLFEAAVAYYKATGKRKLLDVSCRFADHMMSIFGPGKRDWVPGHEEVELALVKLYETTGQKKYLDFAHWLIEERGHGYGVYDIRFKDHVEYFQDDRPVAEMRSIAGHAVRAMFLYCGMVDVTSYLGTSDYMVALDSLWEDVVCRNMYITGGIGQSKHNEGFTADYSLPNKEAYCETCASVGMVFWNWRMMRMTGDAKYVDVLEKSMYNGALDGISLTGDHFFYVNPLASDGDHHRKAWYGCACCPSQLCRFLPSMGNYIYGMSDKGLYVNLFIPSNAHCSKDLDVEQKTAYPWDGRVELTLHPRKTWKKELRIRIPAWCQEASLTVNGQAVGSVQEGNLSMDKGYAVLVGSWKEGDKIVLDMNLPVRVEAADPRVKEDEGLRAVVRGPLVYCMEEVDNPQFDKLSLTPDTQFTLTEERPLSDDIRCITATGKGGDITLIPYFAWDNRVPGKMQVWIPYQD